jgi:hypothetical protein
MLRVVPLSNVASVKPLQTSLTISWEGGSPAIDFNYLRVKDQALAVFRINLDLISPNALSR